MHVAVGRAPAVVRVTRLQTTIRGPDDAWGRGARPQPMLVSADVSLRAGGAGSASAASDALAGDTVHYGRLGKALLAGLGRLAEGGEQQQPLPLFTVLLHMWLHLTGRDPLSSGQDAAVPEPLIKASAVRCLELTAHLPKASLLGDGVSLTLTGVFPGAKGHGEPVDDGRLSMYGRTLRLHKLRVPTLVGINDNEREAKQAIIVSVEVDNFVALVDTYHALEACVVEKIEASSFGTLEALAAHLADTVSRYLRAEQQEPLDGSGSHLTITVEKPIAVPFADAPSVELRTNTNDVLGPVGWPGN
ncbi:dihydroneopterin aldolase domain-containing protein [Hirsutella rhossiliensis]|uniref:dihydroneopterin aldolase n=1 Tax=Hirsutella rhossiliensis TaxID=111463 RepID=A0A9P8SGA6_9HYPO|nr:dihydroneopterin aldolase domain-containing protein [Hirsutella rhossiliensis]KAH0960934.1 dihydroneopterin aldolase domain-containing protein [Hirsutella rhossiliensis]